MDVTEFVDKLRQGSMTRREATCALGAAGLAVSWMPVTGRPAAASESTVHYHTWGGFELPELHQPYVSDHGAIESTYMESEEDSLQKIRQGFTPDVAHPCSYSVRRWADHDIIVPIDESRLSNFGDVWPQLKGITGTVVDGNRYWVPFEWGTASVLYRTDMVDPSFQENETYAIMWDPAYEGKVSMWDAIDGPVQVAALYIGIEDPHNLTDEQIAEVKTALEAQRPINRFYWTDTASLEQSMASGEVIAAYAWNTSLANLALQDIPVRLANPKEGALTWSCGLSVIKGHEASEDLVYDFINAMLAPESGAAMIDLYYTGHSNMKTYEIANQEIIALIGMSDADDLFQKGVFVEEVPADVREKIVTMWDEMRAGM